MSEALFKNVTNSLAHLMNEIEMGVIGLPDIQRPFVWPNRKVRDLFDSLYRGYPVGYFLFWENKLDTNAKNIGTNQHQKYPSQLIVDGQQRLTSLYAVIKDIAVIRDNYNSEKIEIAFRPLDGKFEVADAAIKRDPEWIPNISIMFSPNASQYKIVGDYINRLEKVREDSGRPLTEDERKQCEQAMQRLFNIMSFTFTVLALSADIDEEQVAEVFVRINSQGKSLNQSDFILTLMSVFWEDGRKELEEFCKKVPAARENTAGPFNYFIEPDPEQLLRVSISHGFRRARLKYAYSLLRGKDLETGVFSSEQRDNQFSILMSAQQETLNLQNWHDFLQIIQQSGFRSSKQISSRLTLMYTYSLYLIGKVYLNVPRHDLNKAIGKWFFMASLTTRYTGGSPETMMERDLADLREVKTADGFINWMDKAIDAELTDDFWQITLPMRLETSSVISPAFNCYIAALNLLEAKALFSEIKIWDALDPSTKALKSKVERHHLFPKNYLNGFGIRDTRDTNQIANYAYVEWNDNISISDAPPSEYYEKYTRDYDQAALDKMNYWHALPVGWHSLTYREFLVARRKLIAGVTKDGFARLSLGKGVVERPVTLVDMIAAGEGPYTEFKSTLRVNLHTNQNDPRMEHAILKTINGFLNSDGGTLVVGVGDKGNAVGIEVDGFPNEDKMDLHLGNLIKDRLGPNTMLYIKPRFEDYKGKRILLVPCKASQVPVYMKNGQDEEFYIRAGGSSARLTPSQMTDYIKQRFG